MYVVYITSVQLYYVNIIAKRVQLYLKSNLDRDGKNIVLQSSMFHNNYVANVKAKSAMYRKFRSTFSVVFECRIISTAKAF